MNTRHILLRPKVSEKELTEACARLDSIGDDIRQNKFTFDEAASVISQDKDTRNNHGLMVNTNERTGITTSKFQMQDLPQDVAKQKHTYVRIDPNWQKCDFKYPGWVRND